MHITLYSELNAPPSSSMLAGWSLNEKQRAFIESLTVQVLEEEREQRCSVPDTVKS